MATINAANAGTYAFDDSFKVNRLGYGVMQLTGPGTWGPYADPENGIKVIQKALEYGVNFFDTADSYGPWFADRYLAAGLQGAKTVTKSLFRIKLVKRDRVLIFGRPTVNRTTYGNRSKFR